MTIKSGTRRLQKKRICKAWFSNRRKWWGRVLVSETAMPLGHLRWYGNVFGWCGRCPVVSPTPQSRWKKLRSAQLLRMSPMHNRHVPVDAGTSPSLTKIWKPGLIQNISLADKENSLLRIRFLTRLLLWCTFEYLERKDAYYIHALLSRNDKQNHYIMLETYQLAFLFQEIQSLNCRK